MSKETENMSESLKSSPHLVGVMVIVSAFLFYLYRHDELEIKNDERKQLVSVQRIEQCHDMQKRSSDIMDKLSMTLNSQATHFHELSVTLRDLKIEVTLHNDKMSVLLQRLEAAERNILENRKNKD